MTLYKIKMKATNKIILISMSPERLKEIMNDVSWVVKI
jgi:hypothetical protein